MPSMETAVIHFKARSDIRLKIQNKSMNLCEDICCPGENVEGCVHELVSVYINTRQRKTTHLRRETFIKQIHAHKLLFKLHHCEWRNDKILYLQATLKQSFIKKLPRFDVWTWKKKKSISVHTTAPDYFIHVSVERDTSKRMAWCQFHSIKDTDIWTSFTMRASCVVNCSRPWPVKKKKKMKETFCKSGFKFLPVWQIRNYTYIYAHLSN